MGRKLENVTSPEFAEAVRRAKVTERPDRMEGDHLGFYTEFPTREGEQVLMRTAISFVSLEGAEANFKAELRERTSSGIAKRRLRCGTRPCRKSKSPEGRKMSARFFILRCTTR